MGKVKERGLLFFRPCFTWLLCDNLFRFLEFVICGSLGKCQEKLIFLLSRGKKFSGSRERSRFPQVTLACRVIQGAICHRTWLWRVNHIVWLPTYQPMEQELSWGLPELKDYRNRKLVGIPIRTFHSTTLSLPKRSFLCPEARTISSASH